MAKKTTPEQQYNQTLIQIQKLANSSAKDIQKLVNESNKTQMTFNSAEAQKSRDWQTQMSKTAHQMEVQDLKKAGLNPVLSTGGTGAQSYTTSSASTQNDSGSSAVGAMLGSELGAMSNMESARMTSEAQKTASAQQAAATKYAAKQSAQATKYAAKMNAEASRYGSDLSYSSSIYGSDTQSKITDKKIKQDQWKTKNQTASTWPGVIDKNLRNFGIYKSLGKLGRHNINYAFGTKGRKFIMNNKKSFFNSKGNLTVRGYQNGVSALRSCNIQATRQNVNLYYKATVNHDKKALKFLLKQTPEYLMSKQTHGKVKINPFATKPGWR